MCRYIAGYSESFHQNFACHRPNMLLRMAYMITRRQVRVALTQTLPIDVTG